ncbi:MAG: hypothetical protein ACFFDY_03070 [Candidatus Thorarchaeota archaeon]
MGLDRWIKSEDIEENSKKKKISPEQVKPSKNKRVKEKDHKKQSIRLKKFTLVCPNAKCKYQKIIMKKELTDDDKICPRCNKPMKIN